MIFPWTATDRQRGDPQPVGPLAHAGRVLRWLGGGRVGRPGRGGHRLGRGRLDPDPRRRLRSGRDEAEPRPRPRRRVAGHVGLRGARAHGGRQRAHARGDARRRTLSPRTGGYVDAAATPPPRLRIAVSRKLPPGLLAARVGRSARRLGAHRSAAERARARRRPAGSRLPAGPGRVPADLGARRLRGLAHRPRSLDARAQHPPDGRARAATWCRPGGARRCLPPGTATTARITALWDDVDVLVTPALAKTAIAARGRLRASGAAGHRHRRALHPVHADLQPHRPAGGRRSRRAWAPTDCRSPCSSSVGWAPRRRCTRSPARSRRPRRGPSAAPPCHEIAPHTPAPAAHRCGGGARCRRGDGVGPDGVAVPAGADPGPVQREPGHDRVLADAPQAQRDPPEARRPSRRSTASTSIRRSPIRRRRWPTCTSIPRSGRSRSTRPRATRSTAACSRRCTAR